MSADEQQKNQSPQPGVLDRFEPGGELGVIEDRDQYENRLQSLPNDERRLANLCARFADLCEYFARQRMDLPREVLAEVAQVSRLTVRERIAAMERLNQALMEYLHDVGQDPGIRQ